MYVDPKAGADTNAGTLAAPYKTLQRAQTAVRAALTANDLPVTVYLRGGTYFVGETLKFGPQDGGTSPDFGVTWAAFESEQPVLSGGVDLTGMKWTAPPAGAEAWTATLPPAAAGVQTLFVGGLREIRAKFPNGDPLIPGGAGWAARANGAHGSFAATGDAFPATVNVVSSVGILLSTGADETGADKTFTVKEPEFAYNPTRNDFYAYANKSAERFDTQWNHPFWNSQTSPGFTTGALTKKWQNASTGIVQMYHSGGWGGWTFQVADRPADDTVVFGCRRLSDNAKMPCPQSDPSNEFVIDGGFQECRGATIKSNAYYVENIAEELDDTREWFATASGELRYIPDNTTNLADESTPVVGAVLKRVIEVDGAANLMFKGLTVTHTVPTYRTPSLTALHPSVHQFRSQTCCAATSVFDALPMLKSQVLEPVRVSQRR
jgi:hypothetical protein